MATENRVKTGGSAATQFKKGDDPRRNKGGRPRDTDEVKKAKEEMRKLTLPAVRILKEALEDPETKTAEKIKITEIILDRVMGKAAQPIMADVFRAEQPLTMDECFAIAEEVLNEQTGGSDAP